MAANSRCPMRTKAVVVNVDEGDVITVANPLTGKVFVFNDVARTILELSDGATPLEEIALRVAAEFPGANLDQVSRDVAEFVDACLDAQLVTVS